MSEQQAALDQIVALVTDKAAGIKDPMKPYVGLEHIPSDGSRLLDVGTSADSISTNNVFCAGDILFGKLRPRLRKSVRVDFDGYCSTDILVLRPVDSSDGDFANFVLRSNPVFGEAVRTEEGTKMPRCSWQSLRNLRVFCPLGSQRQRIAEILSTLDEQIEQTEALIGKLRQIKAGLMHDLFTRGVTPAGQLRPPREHAPHLYKQSSLGWISKEWRLTKLGDLADIVSGVTLGSNDVGIGIDVPYLRVANVQDGYFDLTDVKTIRVSHAVLDKLQLRDGDVLMNEGGDFDKLGRGSVWQEEISPCIHQNHVFRVRPKGDSLRSHYLAFWSQSECGRRYFLISSKQSTNLASINSTQLHKFPVALPLPDEQRLIETPIFSINERCDALMQDLAKLRHLKHGLMHDLLTGRVPVILPEHTQLESIHGKN